jgi:ferredoxin
MDVKGGVLKGLLLKPPKKVDRPTYEIVGPVERYDMRDYTYSRISLKPGTPNYEEYYSLHPEKKEVDDEMRHRADKKGLELLEKDPVNENIALSGFYGTMAVSPPKVVNSFKRMPLHPPGRPDVVKRDLDPQKMALKLKAFGMHLGAFKVGIARLNQDWVYSHSNAPWGEPVDMDYENIICMAFAQDNFMSNNHDGFGENFEVGWMYSYASFISITMANFIRNLGWRARPLPAFNAPYIVGPVFVDAGIGEYGRCGYVVSKEVGNTWRPGAVATDLPLAIDKPVDFGLQDFCEKCGICAELCPSGAIPRGEDAKTVVRGIRRWQLDDNKCYRYWVTIGHACGICQSVCPWNHRTNLMHKMVRETAESSPSLRNFIIKCEEIFYNHKRGPEPKWMTDDIYE